MVLMFSVNGAQLYQSKQSDCWMGIRFRTGNPWVGFSHTTPAPTPTVLMVGAGTYQPVIVVVSYETCRVPCTHSRHVFKFSKKSIIIMI